MNTTQNFQKLVKRKNKGYDDVYEAKMKASDKERSKLRHMKRMFEGEVQ